MYQAGIKNITLYENTGITFNRYDPLNQRAITNIITDAATIFIDNINQPEFDIKLKFKNGRMAQDFKIEFLLLGLTLENYDLLNQIKTSIYGWCFKVEFYDGSFRYYNTPVWCRESEIKPHDEMSFKATLENTVSSVEPYYELTPTEEVSSTPIYRWDTTLLTWDSEIYTFDYEL
jgi:hypothetical protein